MDEKQKEQLANARVKMQETAKKTAEQAEKVAGAAKKEWSKASPGKKKKITGAVACVIGILWLFRDGIGLKGAVFAMGLAACGWLVFCVVKKKAKKAPIIVTAVLLVLAFMVTGGNSNQIEQITQRLQKSFSSVVGEKTDTDGYLIYNGKKLKTTYAWVVKTADGYPISLVLAEDNEVYIFEPETGEVEKIDLENY